MKELTPLTGELPSTGTGLRCCPCLDAAIERGASLDDVPAAITMAPVVQGFTMQGNQVMAPVVVPVCAECRKRQMGIKSKAGLIAV
jgi:hypothetical protein